MLKIFHFIGSFLLCLFSGIWALILELNNKSNVDQCLMFFIFGIIFLIKNYWRESSE